MNIVEWVQAEAAGYLADLRDLLTRPSTTFLFRNTEGTLLRSIRFTAISGALGLLSLQFIHEFQRPLTWASVAYLALLWISFALAVDLLVLSRPGRVLAAPSFAIALVSLGLSYLLAAVAVLVMTVVIALIGWSLSLVFTFFGVQFLILLVYLLLFALSPGALGKGLSGRGRALRAMGVVAAVFIFLVIALTLYFVLTLTPLPSLDLDSLAAHRIRRGVMVASRCQLGLPA